MLRLEKEWRQANIKCKLYIEKNTTKEASELLSSSSVKPTLRLQELQGLHAQKEATEGLRYAVRYSEP